MKNKEKWEKEIAEIAITGDSIAVLIKTGKPVGCEYLDGCKGYLFFNSTCSCKCGLKKWAEEEYIEKPKISRSDRLFLNYIQDGYRYIARDNNGLLFAYKAKPGRGEITWTYELDMLNVSRLKVDFPMVKWENKEPWLIEDLKKLEVVDEY